MKSERQFARIALCCAGVGCASRLCVNAMRPNTARTETMIPRMVMTIPVFIEPGTPHCASREVVALSTMVLAASPLSPDYFAKNERRVRGYLVCIANAQALNQGFARRPIP